MQYTSNLSNLNRVESADLFNHTRRGTPPVDAASCPRLGTVCVPTLGPSPRPSRHGGQPHARRGRQRTVRRAAPRTALADGDVIWARVPIYRHSAWGEGP